MHRSTCLRFSWLAYLPFLLYQGFNCRKHWSLGRVLVKIICKLEHGAMYSGTARKILSKFHDVEIGAYSYGPCFMPGEFPPNVNIGRYCSIAKGVRIVNENHPTDKLTTHPCMYVEGDNRHALMIENDVWIGFDAIVLPGCQRIGNGAIIGAGAVVTKDVPDYAIVAGNPARILKYRFPRETIVQYLQSQWWTKDIHEIGDKK